MSNDRALRALRKWADEQKHRPAPKPENPNLPPGYDLIEHMRQGSAYKYAP